MNLNLGAIFQSIFYLVLIPVMVQQERGGIFCVWRFRIFSQETASGVDGVEHRASQVALVIKNLPASAGDSGLVSVIPGLGGSPGGRNGNPLQYSC